VGSRVLAGCVLFQGLSEDALDAAEALARTVTRGRGQVYFRQGEPATHVYAVLSGQVKLVAVHPDGRAVIHRVVGPGEVFGGLAMLGEQLYPVTAESWEESTALAWTGEDLHQLVLRYPQTALNLLHMAAGRVRELQARVEELVAERVERRIARAVLRLVRHAGRRSEEGVVIDLPLSREDLANLTGTTLFTVSRVLSRWEERGMVVAGRQRLVIRSLHAFAEVAEDLTLPESKDAEPPGP
jgi:CRP-like cAMP-binding protein